MIRKASLRCGDVGSVEGAIWENTPLKTNMEPENTPLEKEKHLQTTDFWVPCLF